LLYSDLIASQQCISPFQTSHVLSKNTTCSGYECTKNWLGGRYKGGGLNPRRNRPSNPAGKYWHIEQRQRNPNFDPSNRYVNKTLCDYLAEESESEGMRVFIEFYNKLYESLFNNYVWAKNNPLFGERTLPLCFSNFTTSVEASAHQILEFLHVSGDGMTGTMDNREKFKGAHGTSHDPEEHARLRAVVEKLDSEYYNNDIAFLHSILPCQ